MFVPDEEFLRCARVYNQIADLRNKICHGYIGHEEGFVRSKIERRLRELFSAISELIL